MKARVQAPADSSDHRARAEPAVAVAAPDVLAMAMWLNELRHPDSSAVAVQQACDELRALSVEGGRGADAG